MDIPGVIYWMFRSAGDLAQWFVPILSLGAALLWCRKKDGPLCYLALIGALVTIVGKITQWLLPAGITWIAQSRIEYIPTGSTTLLEAVAYSSFPYIGMGIFVVAVFVHFCRKSAAP